MHIVIGLGIVGSAAAYQLARRGHKVIGFDAHARGHNLGSSHGKTRITRQAYFEAPEYVPLIQRSQALWEELAEQSGHHLFSKIGGLFVGEADSELVQGSLKSAQEHGLPHELLSSKQIEKRFPAFRMPPHAMALLEPNAGILHADRCLQTLQDAATESGAQLHFNEPILSWQVNADNINVTTAYQTYNASGLILAAGPWSPAMLGLPDLPLSVRRVLCAHFQPQNQARFSPDNLPVWCLQFDGKFLYGFPNLADQGLKVGRHDSGEICTAETVRRHITNEEIAQLQMMIETYLPGAASRVQEPLTCLYTDTPDGHFVLDRHPSYNNVVFMSGCSGHAFKLAPVLGEVLAELALYGTTQHPIAFLSPLRFARRATPEYINP